MIHLNYRPLLVALFALYGATVGANAQLVDVLTEAPVTIQVSIQSTVTKKTPTEVTITPTTVRLTNLQVIEELIASKIIPDTTATGWSLVAVRNVPVDLFFVDAGFYLYAIKGSIVVPVPTTKFSARVGGSVEKFTEKTLGRYIYSSSGTVTNHVHYSYTPSFTSGASNTYTLSSSESSGFAKIQFSTVNNLGDFEVFLYRMSSISCVAHGGYSGLLTQLPNLPVASSGLFTVTLTVGAPKLVLATKYPAVDPSIGQSIGE